MDKNIIIGGVILLIVGVVIWVFIESTKPMPGEKLADLGRDHVAVGTQVDYNSNPPTSGPHYADWTRAGIYQTPLDDGYLVHSLEHGYVIISYNCAKLESRVNPPAGRAGGQELRGLSLINSVFAHGVEEEVATQSATQATSSAQLPLAFASDDCHQLVDQLISVYERKGKKKLIIVPRPSLDSKIALTAWTRLEKLNDVEQKKIEQFIDAYRDRGPEKTME